MDEGGKSEAEGVIPVDGRAAEGVSSVDGRASEGVSSVDGKAVTEANQKNSPRWACSMCERQFRNEPPYTTHKNQIRYY